MGKKFEFKSPVGGVTNLEFHDEYIDMHLWKHSNKIRYIEIIVGGIVSSPEDLDELAEEKTQEIIPPGIRGAMKFMNQAIQVMLVVRDKNQKKKLIIIYLGEDSDQKGIIDEFQHKLSGRWLGHTTQKILFEQGDYKYNFFTLIPALIVVFAISAAILLGWWVFLYYFKL